MRPAGPASRSFGGATPAAGWRRSAASCARSRASAGCSERRPHRRMASVDVPVALLGYGTVGAAASRLLAEGADENGRATGDRLRVVRALVRDPTKEREFAAADGVLTTDFRSVLEDRSVALVAEVMGGIEP